MIETQIATDGQTLLRITAGPNPAPGEGWHSLNDWKDLVAETATIRAAAGHEFTPGFVDSVYAKLNARKPSAAPAARQRPATLDDIADAVYGAVPPQAVTDLDPAKIYRRYNRPSEGSAR